ncbi:transcription factor SOX-4-like [Hippoglossus hippoglossus]|uniref:transcription factor SOX-4-like n=1 Tax=Hippoglossus hippoglossus TaxID=8267 RepID=UPI00148BABDC|nr:transcription factor SOX-4-like [Hippoglossus hippoglossus]
MCRSRPDIGPGGSVEVGTGGGHSTSSGRGTTQPGGGGGGGSRPDIGHDRSVEAGTGGGHSASSGRGRQPGSGGSSSTSANRPLFIPIDNCKTRPIVPNGVVVEEHRMYLKFKCNSFYKQVGLDTVSCYNDGSWSKLPVCEAWLFIAPIAESLVPAVVTPMTIIGDIAPKAQRGNSSCLLDHSSTTDNQSRAGN